MRYHIKNKSSKLFLFAVFFTLASFFVSVPLNANENFHLGFVVGLAVPNEKVSQFFNDSREQLQWDSFTTIGNYVLDKASSLGYYLGVHGRLPLSNNFAFVPRVSFSRFNEGNYNIDFPFIDTVFQADVKSVTNVVTIGGGFNLYLLKSFISPYIHADLSYHYIKYTIDYEWRRNISIPIVSDTHKNSLGYSFGAGIDIDMYLFDLNIEAKWNVINLIKGHSDEPLKNNFSITFGIVF